MGPKDRDLSIALRAMREQRREQRANWDKRFLRTMWPVPVVAGLVFSEQGLTRGFCFFTLTYMLLGCLTLGFRFCLFLKEETGFFPKFGISHLTGNRSNDHE